MQVIKGSPRIADALFEIGVIIQAVVMIIGYSAWDVPYRGYILHISFALFCFKILMTEYDKKEWIILIFLGGVGCISYFLTREEYVFSVVVMIFAAKSVHLQKIMKIVFYSVVLSMMFIPILSVLGLGHPLYDVRDYGRGGVEKRWGFGLGHANNFHGTIWYGVTLAIILYRKNMKWFHFLGMTLLNCLLFLFTVSKAGFLCTQIVIIVGWIYPYISRIINCNSVYILGIIGTLGIQIISILSVIYNIEDVWILRIMDGWFTGRIRLARELVPIEKWRLLSSAGDTQYVDNGWVSIYANYGYIIGIIYLFLHIWLIYKMWKKKVFMEYTILLTSVFYTFMESTYCLNNAYLLSNVTYILAMLIMGKDFLYESINGE